MTKPEVIEELCAIVALVFHSVGKFTSPSDGFCHRCERINGGLHFQHSGETIDFVRQAVVEKLKRDGFPISESFDPETGKEINKEIVV